MKKNQKILSRAATVMVVSAVTVFFLFLVYLYNSPNVDFKSDRSDEYVKMITEYQISEHMEESAPMGVVQEYQIKVNEELCRKHLVFFTTHQYVRVFLEGNLLYQWYPTEDVFMGKTLGSHWVSVPFFDADEGKEILVEVTPVYESAIDDVPTFMAGEEQTIYEEQLKVDNLQIILSVVTLITGIVFVIVSLWQMLRTKSTGKRLFYLGMFACCVGMWRLTDIPFMAYLFVERSVFLYDLSIGLLMICMIPMVCFVGYGCKCNWPMQIYSLLCSSACLIQTCLQIFGWADLRETLRITHGMLLLGIVSIILLIRLNREETMNKAYTFLVRKLSVICVAGVILDLINYYNPRYQSGLFFTVVSVLVYVFISGIILISEYISQEKKIIKQDKQLLEAKTEVMLSQIQPHFLYNTLNSIAELCLEDANTARAATIDFAEYLRVNLKGIKEKSTVSFVKELEHVKRYLSLEKMRFEEDLNVVYDIQAIDFEVPQLAIQPLVENAVKHGVGEQEDGGTVTVRSYEQGNYWCVAIEDDGVGFVMSEIINDGKVHVGIQNSRMRIQKLCGGELEIRSEINQGTTALIRIPKEKM